MTGFIILMASLMSVVAISIDAMLPALGSMGQALGATHPNQAQFIIGFLFIGMTVGQLVFGPMSDAIGRKKVLYIGLGLYALGSYVCYMSQDMTQMLAGRLIQGFGIASPYISCMAIIRDKFSGREMARIMSLVMTIFILVPCVAPSLGQMILKFWSWREIFLLFIILCFAMSTYIFFRLEETLKPENRIKFCAKSLLSGFKTVITNRQTVGYTLCIGFIFGGFLGYLNSAQQIFSVQFNVAENFPLYFGGLALVFGVSSLVNSHFVKKFGMQPICLGGMIVAIGASIAFLSLHYVIDITLWMFIVYATILFFVCGLMFGNLNSLAMEPMGAIAGIAASIIGFLAGIIDTGLGALIGQFYNNSLIPIILGFLLTNLCALTAMHWAESKKTIIN